MSRSGLSVESDVEVFPAAHGALGNGTGDDWQALTDACAEAKAIGGTIVLGRKGASSVYRISKPLDIRGVRIRQSNVRDWGCKIMAHPSWDLANGAHVLRMWADSDYGAGETDKTIAPRSTASPSYFVYLDGVWIDVNHIPGLSGFGGLHINETSYLRDVVLMGPDPAGGSIGHDLQSNNDAQGACVNGGFWENIQWYGSGWKHLLRAVGLPRPASLTSGAGEAGVVFTAKDRYAADNTISVTIVAGAGALAVSVAGNDITVTLASGGSTAAAVRAAVNASTPAAALVTASLVGSTGASNVVAAAQAFLANGGLDKAQTYDFAGDLRINGMVSASKCAASPFDLRNMHHVIFNGNHCESYVDPALSANTDLAIVRTRNVKDFQDINPHQTLTVALAHSRWKATNTLTSAGGASSGGPTQVSGMTIRGFTQLRAFGSYSVPILDDGPRGFTSSDDIAEIYAYDGTQYRYRTNDGVEHATVFVATPIPKPVVTIADANYAILAADEVIEYTGLSAARTATLPTSNAANKGREYVIKDTTGNAGRFPITVAGTIDGSGGGAVIREARGQVRVVSNGSGGYDLVAAIGEVKIGPTFSADGSPVLTSQDRLLAYTSLTAARAPKLPTPAAGFAGKEIEVLDVSGSCSGTNTITISANDASNIGDKVTNANVASVVLGAAFAYARFKCLWNGSAYKWFRVA